MVFLEGFADALGRLSNAEFFAALGMALFGLAAVVTVRLLHDGREAYGPATRLDHDEAA